MIGLMNFWLDFATIIIAVAIMFTMDPVNDCNAIGIPVLRV